MKKRRNVQQLQNNGVMVIAMRPSKGGRAEDGKLLSRLEWPNQAIVITF